MADHSEITVEKIVDDDELYRQVHPTQFVQGTGEVLSSAFKSKELSVNLARLCSPEETAQAAISRGRQCEAVVAFTAGFARYQCRQEVKYDPIPADDPDGDGPNPAHCLVIGEKDKGPKPRVAHLLKSVSRTVWLLSESEQTKGSVQS